MRKRTDSSKAVVANTTCPNPTPSVRKPPGTSGDEYGVAASASPSTSSTSTPHGAVVRTRRLTRRALSVVVGAVGDVGPDRAEPLDGGVEGGGVDGLEADRNRVVGRSGLHHEPLGPRVVAPGAARPPAGSPGMRPTTSASTGVIVSGSGSSRTR